jgi:hypothetical protein
MIKDGILIVFVIVILMVKDGKLLLKVISILLHIENNLICGAKLKLEWIDMGMYCCCGIKKRDEWKCECDWDGWFLRFNPELHQSSAPIKDIPEKDGKYLVRVFEDGDDYETESDFSVVKKNWGESTNNAICNWRITYDDNWMGYRGVYAWKDTTHRMPLPKPPKD